MGEYNGRYQFTDGVGQVRDLTARQLTQRGELASLFGGDTDWLLAQFPRLSPPDPKTGLRQVMGIAIGAAGEWLMRQCRTAGLYDPSLPTRGAGVWLGPQGQLIVHCGDVVFVDGKECRPGLRLGVAIYRACPKTPRPDAPATPQQAEDVLEVLRLWQWAQPKMPELLLGIMAVAYLGEVASWRPHGSVSGPTGSGKTTLKGLLQKLLVRPLYLNGTTAAGLRQALNGSAVPTLLDELEGGSTGTPAVIELIRLTSGGDGARVARGTAGGTVQHFDAITVVLMMHVDPPEMAPQDQARIIQFELAKPDAEGKFRNLDTEAARVSALGPALWGRMLAGVDRYRQNVAVFRVALLQRQCLPRQADQLGAMLAGWWTLVSDLPVSTGEAPGIVDGFAWAVVTENEAADDDAPQRCLQHLLSTLAPMQVSAERVPVGVLLERALLGASSHGADAERLLLNLGIKVTMREGVRGIWLAHTASPLNDLFARSPGDAGRWRTQLRRLEGAAAPNTSKRFGHVTSKAIWLPQSALGLGDPDEDGHTPGHTKGQGNAGV